MTRKPVLQVSDIGAAALKGYCAQYGVRFNLLAAGENITGSFWGAPEAGIIGRNLYVRDDTPVHSLLHELSHIICLPEERRKKLHTDAGSDDAEEAAVCYLQIVLGEEIAGVGKARIMRDMDTWGYSFPEGSTSSWFENASDARTWLVDKKIIDAQGQALGQLRTAS